MYIGHSSENRTLTSFRILDGFQIICKVESTRYDSTAADLGEGRNEFLIVETAKDLKASPFASARMAANLRVLYDKMNANRIKGIFFEVPHTISVISNLFLNILPKKIKQRVSVGSNLRDLKALKQPEMKEMIKSNLPTKLGGDGSWNVSLEEWFRERLEHRNRSDQLVNL